MSSHGFWSFQYAENFDEQTLKTKATISTPWNMFPDDGSLDAAEHLVLNPQLKEVCVRETESKECTR